MWDNWGIGIIATAQAFGLKTMIGCMGESSISIAAAAAVSGVLDHIDLDSHLNLNPTCTGAPLVNELPCPQNYQVMVVDLNRSYSLN